MLKLNTSNRPWVNTFFLFFLLVCSAKAQNFDDIISSNRYIDCDDVTFNASTLIRGFYDENQIAEIYDFLNYWESKCGQIDVINRFRTILDINGNRFNSRLISEQTITDLLLYRSSLNPVNDTLNAVNDFNRSLKSLENLVQRLARNSNSRTADERLILDFYADESPSFQAIKNAPETSRLKEMHATTYDKASKMWQLHWAFALGIYNPYGNISIFGTRPSFGAVFGGKRLRHNIDFIFDIRAGPSKEDYSFVYQGDLITDDTWTGIYIGGEYTYDFINSSKFDVGISPGIGYESITALGSDEDTDEDGKYLESFNYNVGLVLKYKYGKRGGYVGLHVRYNWADYDNFGGTLLDGEYLNVRLTLGRLFSHERNFLLENLE